jgi:TorA maturation chaperone TorD
MEEDKSSRDHNILKGYNMLLYFAGSMIMYEPSEECVVDFWRNGILKKLPVSSSNPNFIKASSQLRESCADQRLCGAELREDYNRLFSKDTFPLAPAFETLYPDCRQLSSVSTFAEVSEFYTSYGWQSKLKGKIPDDHLGMELLFLTTMVEKYTVMDDPACRIEMRREIRRYLDNHILSWVPSWNDKMQIYSHTLCYKAIGTLIYACSQDIYGILLKQ